MFLEESEFLLLEAIEPVSGVRTCIKNIKDWLSGKDGRKVEKTEEKDFAIQKVYGEFKAGCRLVLELIRSGNNSAKNALDGLKSVHRTTLSSSTFSGAKTDIKKRIITEVGKDLASLSGRLKFTYAENALFLNEDIDLLFEECDFYYLNESTQDEV